MSKFETTDTTEEVKPGDIIYIKLEVPDSKDLPVGRLDRILKTLLKKGKVKKISKNSIE